MITKQQLHVCDLDQLLLSFPNALTTVAAPACLYMQEGHHATPRACATPYPCVVRQGLLFVKPKALPKQPVASDDSSNMQHNTSSNSFSSSSSSFSRSSNAAASGASGSAVAGEQVDAGVDVSGLPLVPEFDDPAWLVQDTWRDVPYDW
jgi:hypothetical protein